MMMMMHGAWYDDGAWCFAASQHQAPTSFNLAAELRYTV